jgi:transposase-like protein
MDHMQQRFPNLTVPQFKAVAALAAGKTVSTAAREAGVSRQTLYEWRNLEEFRNAWTEAKSVAIQGLMDELKDLTRDALQTLHNLLHDPASTPNVRLKAALAVLNRFENTGHPGWVLPQAVQEPKQAEAERKMFAADLARSAARPSLTKPDAKPVSPNRNSHGRPFYPCVCGSGDAYVICCMATTKDTAA